MTGSKAIMEAFKDILRMLNSVGMAGFRGVPCGGSEIDIQRLKESILNLLLEDKGGEFFLTTLRHHALLRFTLLLDLSP